MKANGLSVLVLEKAKKKFSESDDSDDGKIAMQEASKKFTRLLRVMTQTRLAKH